MRCASCGTENAPDSRFCGGCGARLGASGPRVAPTQKISDDAAFPQRPVTPPPVAAPTPVPGPIAHGSAQPSAPRVIPKTPYVPNAPPVITTQPGVLPPQRPSSAPPISAAPASAPMNAPPVYSPPSGPPHAHNGAPRPAPSRPLTSRPDEPSISMPTMARRPWGLIMVVLIIDVALAASGAWMLSQGLGDSQSAKNAAPRSSAVTTPGLPTATTHATGAAPAASGPSSTSSK